MKITSQLSFDEAEESTHVIGVFAAEGKGAPESDREEFNDLLAKLAAEDVFKGKKGQAYFVRATDDATPNLLFVGLGKAEEATGETFRIAGAVTAKRLEGEKVKAAALDLASFLAKGLEISAEKATLGLAQGALFSQYSFDIYKSEKAKPVLAEIAFYAGDRKKMTALENAIEQAEAENDAVVIARDLSNEPGSILYPMELARRAQKLAKEYGLTFKVLDEKACKKEKMEALLGVGMGSVNRPCLIVLEYKPKKKAKKTIAFVGKAVTFDSGGISIKPGQGMEEMKHDMSGGADVLAATLLAARRKCENHIVCVIPSAENMPDAGALIPSAVLRARSGKTIEVQNTDAEGRLILSDALDYAQDYNPDVIIDVATLTGAVVMALSNVAAGIMGNDEGVMNKFKAAAAETEERYVELPIFQEYIDDIKSKIADIKNIGGEKGAGSQKGGAFLKEFIRKGNKWIHVDIAGTAWSTGKVAYHPAHGASGHTVRTLTQFAMDF
jgi:leucyl aminopeptidase